MCSSSSLESQHIDILNKIEQKVVSEESHNAILKREKSMYMREYRKKKKASESRKQASKINEVSTKRNRNPYLREYMKKRRTDEGRMQKSNNRNSSVLSGIDDQTYTTKKNQKKQCHCEVANQNRECHIRVATTAAKSSNDEDLNENHHISKFHEIVSQGPLYICSCCDQLWYKHSVSSANTLKKSNPAAGEKYLINKVSVKHKELLCRTCYKYLIKNKVPPTAILNGMQFPKNQILLT